MQVEGLAKDTAMRARDAVNSPPRKVDGFGRPLAAPDIRLCERVWLRVGGVTLLALCLSR